jgi:hypothetical protein
MNLAEFRYRVEVGNLTVHENKVKLSSWRKWLMGTARW